MFFDFFIYTHRWRSKSSKVALQLMSRFVLLSFAAAKPHFSFCFTPRIEFIPPHSVAHTTFEMDTKCRGLFWRFHGWIWPEKIWT
jgi:hypothetical protein